MALDDRVKCCPAGLVGDRRRRVRVLDCTIRDGGICNDWHFDRDWVRRSFDALVASGVDVMEIGYRTREGAFDRAKVGPWRFLDEDVLADVTRNGKGSLKLAAMLDVGKADPADIRPRGETVLDVIRFATYAHQLPEARRLLDRALELGYETHMNVMAVSTLTPEQVDRFLDELRVSGVHNVAIVDSFGALYPHHVRHLVHVYQGRLGEGIGVGVHTHNNQQQAFANTIAAIDAGADFVDATIHGMGRGAGNCPLELLLFYLDNPRYDVAPVLELVDEYAGLRDELRFGYHLPYAITGYYNVHPRAGIERMRRPDRYDCRGMYESLAGRFGESGGGEG
jgi:4-hydroxy 2-oxovalerate aldolase